jgi:hypothetical protein
MSLSKLESLLEKRALYFCRADRFSDISEGRFPAANQHDPWFFHPTLFVGSDSAASTEWFQRVSGMYDQFRQHVFVSCWHLSDSDTAWMWRQYCADGTGVAIRSTLGKFRASFAPAKHDVVVSQVTYADPGGTRIEQGNFLHSIFRKRPEYAPEKELRAVTLDIPKNFWAPPVKDGQFVSVDLSTLVDRVVVSRAAPTNFTAEVAARLRHVGLDVHVGVSDVEG